MWSSLYVLSPLASPQELHIKYNPSSAVMSTKKKKKETKNLQSQNLVINVKLKYNFDQKNHSRHLISPHNVTAICMYSSSYNVTVRKRKVIKQQYVLKYIIIFFTICADSRSVTKAIEIIQIWHEV